MRNSSFRIFHKKPSRNKSGGLSKNSFHNPDRLVFRQSILPLMNKVIQWRRRQVSGSFHRHCPFSQHSHFVVKHFYKSTLYVEVSKMILPVF